LGLALGHLVLWVFTTWIPEGAKGGFTGAVWYAEELLVLLGSLLLGVLCSLLPAWRAYRTDIHQVLAGG
jgi:putative ABC transport system permease protein